MRKILDYSKMLTNPILVRRYEY